ncbi:hypothetical protein RB595_005414 [Gaeumannomyces hyphopodioides]
MESYLHEPIDLSKKAIRLLCLLAGSYYDPIRCEMYMSLLEEDQNVHIEYEALSYTWGSSETCETIYIEGRPLQVTTNLHAALLCLRREGSGRFLWVDAICIDQANNQEKNHQVGQMGTVYSSAERVLFWLGPSSLETQCLMGLATHLHEKAVQRQPAKRQSSLELWRLVWNEILQEVGEEPKQLQDARTRELQRLLDQAWFRRVWVIQEVALAKRADVVCGRLSAPASAFSLLPDFMGVEVPKRVQALLDVMPGPLRESETSWWRGEREPDAIVKKFADSEASYPPDRIYALLGPPGFSKTFL